MNVKNPSDKTIYACIFIGAGHVTVGHVTAGHVTVGHTDKSNEQDRPGLTQI